MIEEVQALLDEYQVWLRDNTMLREVDEWVEITTPYLDRHNDCLQIYATRNGADWTLSDDGFIIGDLEMSGCTLDTPKRLALLNMTLAGFGVRRNASDALIVRASQNSFATKKHSLLQAMLAVNDLFYLASPTIANLFFEDVSVWLDESQVRNTPRVRFFGESGYDHLFDFVIPKSASEPERMLQTINSPGRDTATRVAFACYDTRTARPDDSRTYAVLNDAQGRISSQVIDALENYEVHPILWSQRDQVRDELSA
jgi:hypothetical protein